MASTADVVLLALNNIECDARTLNLARALHALGYDVAVIGSGHVSDVSVFSWSDPGGKTFQRWRSFNRFAGSLDISTRLVIGMDLFALQAARQLARRNSAALWYDMREFYFALGPLAGRSFKQRLITLHERWLMRSVQHVLVSGYLDAPIVQERFRLAKPPTILLNSPPWKERVFSTYLRDVFAIPTHVNVVLYQGVVHHGRGLAPFMRAMQHLHDVHLCIVGSGPAENDLRQLASEIDIHERVHWHKAVPYDALHAITCSADVGLCLIEPVSESYRYALPNKLFEYMMAGVPILATDLPAIQSQLARIPAGVLVPEQLRIPDIVEAFHRLVFFASYQAMKDVCVRVRTVAYEEQVQYTISQIAALLNNQSAPHLRK